MKKKIHPKPRHSSFITFSDVARIWLYNLESHLVTAFVILHNFLFNNDFNSDFKKDFQWLLTVMVFWEKTNLGGFKYLYINLSRYRPQILLKVDNVVSKCTSVLPQKFNDTCLKFLLKIYHSWWCKLLQKIQWENQICSLETNFI